MPEDTTSNGVDASRRTFLKATGAAATAAAVGSGAAAAEGTGVNVEALLTDLTLEQKVGQMTQIEIRSLDPTASSDTLNPPEQSELFETYQIGSILNGGASPPSFDPQEVAEGINAIQRYNLENADHDIPLAYGVDAVHGNVLLDGSTAFPHNLGVGATRDRDLVTAMARHTAEAVDAMGADWNFSPTTDLQRDPRWGRFYEGFSEDPLLTGEFARATVEGYEGDGDGAKIASTVKHFAGYPIPDNGNDRSAANTSMRDLRTNLLPPFHEALRAEPETVMVNSGSINGVPAHASHWLLTTLLREHYGFEGVVISDWQDFQRMVEMHEYSPDFRTAVKQGIEAGVDMYMVPHDAEKFTSTLIDLVESGEVSEDRIDEAVERIVQMKENLGLFEDPYVDPSRIGEVVGTGRDVAADAARESMTLLKNDDTLPLSGDADVLLTGPATDDVFMQMGGWTLGWQGIAAEDARPAAVTIYEAMQDAMGSGTLTHEPTGFEFTPYADDQEFSFENRDAVVSAAEDADVAVVAVGESPHAEGFGDRDRLALPEPQQRIVDAVAGTDTPVVGVVVAGSPRATADTLGEMNAALMAYQPGTEGGTAVAETLLGEHNPSGRLPFTWPEGVGQVPFVHNQYPPANQEPLYPFGHGLSYTTFEYSDLQVSPGTVSDPSEAGSVTVEVTVENAGDRAGDHIVEVFNTQAYGDVLHADRRRLGSARVSLESGGSERVAIDAPLRALEVVPGDVPGPAAPAVEAGDYEVSVGDQTTTLTIAETASVTGRGPVGRTTDEDDEFSLLGPFGR